MDTSRSGRRRRAPRCLSSFFLVALALGGCTATNTYGIEDDGDAGLEALRRADARMTPTEYCGDGGAGCPAEGERQAFDEDTVPRGLEYRVLGTCYADRRLRWCMGPVPAGLDTSAVLGVMRRAFDAWGAASAYSFGQVSCAENPDLRLAFTARDGRGGVLASANPPRGGGIFFDQAEEWATREDNRDARRDLFTVALHEIGHAIGMDHTVDSRAVMFPYVTVVRRSLNRDDVRGIHYVANACGVCGVSGRECCGEACREGLECRRGTCDPTPEPPRCTRGHACCAGGTCADDSRCSVGNRCGDCGGRGEPCCVHEQCNAGFLCGVEREGVCDAPCGGLGQRCCAGDVCRLSGGLACRGGTCVAAEAGPPTQTPPPIVCGRPGDPCCQNRACGGGTACINGRCLFCCAKCANRVVAHQTGVLEECAASARDYCAVGNRGRLQDAFWGLCAP